MKWFEYQMEVDQLKAPEDLKARLLAMEPKPDQSPKRKEKAKAIRFPHWKRWAAAAAACVVVAFAGSQALQLGGLTVGGAGAASSAALASAPEAAQYSLNAAADNSLDGGAAARSAAGSSTASSVAGDKIIYTASLTLETKDYDTARAGLEQALADAGGWMESSSESNYTGEARTLSMTLRVPEANYESFLEAAGQTGSLVNKYQRADDVTAQYTDVAGRIANLEGQRDRLRELQASAATLSDLLDIEAQLSDVEYQLESWQGQLDWYDDQIASCTVTVTLQEVETYTPTGGSFLERLGTAFAEGWQNFIHGVSAVLVLLAGLWPVVLLVAAVVAVVVIVRRRR